MSDMSYLNILYIYLLFNINYFENNLIKILNYMLKIYFFEIFITLKLKKVLLKKQLFLTLFNQQQKINGFLNDFF